MTRPRLVVYDLASVDGRLTLSPETNLLHGDERWTAVTGCPDPYPWLAQTYRAEAFLEGSGSFVGNDEGPAWPPSESDGGILYSDFLPDEIVQSPHRPGWFVAVDGRGRVRWTIKEWPDEAFKGWHLLVIAHEQTPSGYLEFLRHEAIPYIVAGRGAVDLGLALDKLADLGVSSLVSTAGGRLNGALMRCGLVDEVVVEIFPAVVGGTTTPSLFDAPNLGPKEMPVRLGLMDAEVLSGGHVRLRYEVLGR